jgi:hypothetical protein
LYFLSKAEKPSRNEIALLIITLSLSLSKLRITKKSKAEKENKKPKAIIFLSFLLKKIN